MISTTERCETILIKRITHVEVKTEIHEGNIQRIKLKRTNFFFIKETKIKLISKNKGTVYLWYNKEKAIFEEEHIRGLARKYIALDRVALGVLANNKRNVTQHKGWKCLACILKEN